MKANIYRNQLKAVARFAATKDIRFYMIGVKLESNALQSRIIATDGNAMAVARCDANGDNEGAMDIIIPIDAIKSILSWKISKYADRMPIIITQEGEEYRARYLDNMLVFKQIDGLFPDYRKIVPTSCDGTPSQIDPDLLVRCKRASEDIGASKIGYFAMTQNGNNPSLITIGDDFVAVVMPLRGALADANTSAWARAPLPTPAPALKSVA